MPGAEKAMVDKQTWFLLSWNFACVFNSAMDFYRTTEINSLKEMLKLERITRNQSSRSYS